ncbi:MAG: DegT/DnrJ/EryC1/StrS family aminotransferase [Chloroflexota bacterium]
MTVLPHQPHSRYQPRRDFLPFSPPNITEEEIDAVVDTLRSGWITTGGKTNQFEKTFAEYIGAPAALALSSCTAGLHLAVRILDLKPSDEVITTTLTFCSSVHVIEHVGAKPILVDVEADTLTIDPARIAAAITPNTKAILPVHYAGHPAEMDAIMQLAREHDLRVIEDAAHSLPATYHGQKVGTIGDMTAFSFYATKNLTTGEGGMLTGSPEYIDRARLFSLHGMNRDAWKRYTAAGSWYYEVVEAGFKYNMTDMQAALGLVQLRRLEAMQARRREVVQTYNAAFADLPQLQTPIAREGIGHAWHLYVLRLNLDTLTIDRGQFIDELKRRNIGTSVHFIPVHLHPYYRDKYGYQPEDFPVAYGEYQRMLSLPLHSSLSEADLESVTEAVRDVCTVFAR